jgi:hypothetical protein
LIVAVLIAAVAGFWYKKSPSLQSAKVGVLKPHAYNDPKTDLSLIDLKVLYVVPKNTKPALDWQKDINVVLSDVVEFHKIQFHFSSDIKPEIYPTPVILEHDDTYYDTQNTNFGNPEGLKNIVPELERNYPQFLKASDNDFLAVAIIYEGVGAAGADGYMILSRTYLTKDEYRANRGALFYHEFAHTFGVPDRYDLTNNDPYSGDVMGSGRYKPLDTNYLGRDIIFSLGLTLPK